MKPKTKRKSVMGIPTDRPPLTARGRANARAYYADYAVKEAQLKRLSGVDGIPCATYSAIFADWRGPWKI